MNFNIGGSAVSGNFGGGAFGYGGLIDPFTATSLTSILNYDSNYFWWYLQKNGQPPPCPVNADLIRHHPYRQPLLQLQHQNKKINLNSIGGYLGQQPPNLSLSVMPQADQNPTEVMVSILRAQQQILAAQYANIPALTQPLAAPAFDQHLYNFILQQQIYKANISINLRPNQLKNQSPFQQNNHSRFTNPLKAGSSTQKPYSAKFPNFHQKSATFPPSLAYSHASLLPYQPNANFGMFQASMSELYFAGAAKTKKNR